MSISIAQLKTEDGRREYYTYDPTNPASMVQHAEPYLDPRFNEELKHLFGVDLHGDQRVRVVWGGSEPAISFKQMPDGKSLQYLGKKYPYMRVRNVRGYIYIDKEGKKVTVKSIDRVPEGHPAVEDIIYDDLGIMKFVLEMKFTHAELIAMGRYPLPDDAHAWVHDKTMTYRIKADPNPNGEYIYAHYIETPDGEFCDMTDAWLDQIKMILNRAQTETEEEYIVRKMDARNKLAILTQEAADLKYADAVENARIKAEKKLSRGKVLYG